MSATNIAALRTIRPAGSLNYWGDPTFDGNHTDHIQNWFIPIDGEFGEWDEDLCDTLMQMTVMGHLQWPLFQKCLISADETVTLGA